MNKYVNTLIIIPYTSTLPLQMGTAKVIIYPIEIVTCEGLKKVFFHRIPIIMSPRHFRFEMYKLFWEIILE